MDKREDIIKAAQLRLAASFVVRNEADETATFLIFRSILNQAIDAVLSLEGAPKSAVVDKFIEDSIYLLKTGDQATVFNNLADITRRLAMERDYLKRELAALQILEGMDALEVSALGTFLKGGDIPATIDATRGQLVRRTLEAEAALRGHLMTRTEQIEDLSRWLIGYLGPLQRDDLALPAVEYIAGQLSSDRKGN
jgi:hypothetical protein